MQIYKKNLGSAMLCTTNDNMEYEMWNVGWCSIG